MYIMRHTTTRVDQIIDSVKPNGIHFQCSGLIANELGWITHRHEIWAGMAPPNTIRYRKKMHSVWTLPVRDLWSPKDR